MFEDDLYGGSAILKGGTGLTGFCPSTVGWHYERHDEGCTPGMWRVATYAMAWDDLIDEFHPVLQSTNAVVDDFGNLRRVP